MYHLWTLANQSKAEGLNVTKSRDETDIRHSEGCNSRECWGERAHPDEDRAESAHSSPCLTSVAKFFICLRGPGFARCVAT